MPTITTNRVPINKHIRPANHDNLTQLHRFDKSTSCLNVCLWNCQSVRNKSTYICDYILEHNLDIMIITESWIKENELVVIGECTPPGYLLLNKPRPSVQSCGGLVVIFKAPLKLRFRPLSLTTTYFEHACITDNADKLNLVVIYRPPPSPTNGFR